MTTSPNTKILATNISKTYNPESANAVEAIHNLSLEVKEGEFVSLLGPSGCGKSTFLYMVGGFEKATAGNLTLDGEEITGPGSNRGIVFQEYVLFPWQTVSKNIAYGLTLRNEPQQKIDQVVAKLVKMIGLQGFEDQYPRSLSGGMQQRVAIARAMAYDPDVLLMDEPFGALDAQTRSLMIRDLSELHRATGKTTMFVTHSVEEAILLSTKIFLFSARPSKIKTVYDINLPYPRSVTDHGFVDLQKTVLADLSEEVGNDIA